MNAEIITIGDEILIGQVVNTNQAYIGEQLSQLGIATRRATTTGDDLPEILRAFTRAWAEQELVIVTGGLGPTHDDVTKKALCSFFRCDLTPNSDVRHWIEELLRRRNSKWSAASDEQTLIPSKAAVFLNPVGTAPAMVFEEDGRIMAVMPGVPFEMKALMEQSVVPLLRARRAGNVTAHRTLRTTGIAESLLAAELGDPADLLGGGALAFLPSPRGVRLRATVEDSSFENAERRLDEIERRIRAKAGKYIYAVGEEELEEVLGKLLREKELTIAVAESCTGGLITDRITNVSGSSEYFERGVVAYSNRSKVELLGVPPKLIEAHGAVSKEVAEAMARGIRTKAGSSIGLSTTGIAGPGGGSTEKPVGLVWVGYCDARTSLAIRLQFGDERIRVKERASQAALELVRRRILGIE